jgi:hypothetical protein
MGRLARITFASCSTEYRSDPLHAYVPVLFSISPLVTDLTDFLYSPPPLWSSHRHATPPEWNGYRLTVACSCGVTFERRVTPRDAELDLLRTARLN